MNSNRNKLVDTMHRRIRKEKLRSIVLEAKDRPCTDCGIKYPPHVMDLDHVYGEKEFGIGQTTKRYRSFDELRAEIAKCEVVCANCHRVRTYDRDVDMRKVKIDNE